MARKSGARSTKACNNLIHAKRRLLERYNIGATDELITQLIRAVQTRNSTIARWLFRYSTSQSLWAIKIGSVWVPAVYSKQTRNFVTFLEWPMIYENLRGRLTEDEYLAECRRIRNIVANLDRTD